MLLPNIETKFHNSSISILRNNTIGLRDESGKLSCGHIINKSCLVKSILREFLKNKAYEYLFFCSICQSTKHITSVTLDCGCYTTLREPNCNHPLNLIDSCIINDFSSSTNTFLLAKDYLKRELITKDLCEEIVQSGNVEVIGLVLKFNGEITRLSLRNKDIECIAESLKVNRTLLHLDLSFNKIKDNIKEALKANKTLKYLELQYTEFDFD
jgi:hypothetical protein